MNAIFNAQPSNAGRRAGRHDDTDMAELGEAIRDQRRLSESERLKVKRRPARMGWAPGQLSAVLLAACMVAGTTVPLARPEHIAVTGVVTQATQFPATAADHCMDQRLGMEVMQHAFENATFVRIDQAFFRQALDKCRQATGANITRPPYKQMTGDNARELVFLKNGRAIGALIPTR